MSDGEDHMDRIERALREAERAVAVALSSAGGKRAQGLAAVASAVGAAFSRLSDIDVEEVN